MGVCFHFTGADCICEHTLLYRYRVKRCFSVKSNHTKKGKAAADIHAPREGCDGYDGRVGMYVEISIHAPREGCDSFHTHCPSASFSRFQSTHPARGATAAMCLSAARPSIFQSTHPVRGATRATTTRRPTQPKFQSTHPVRGATRYGVDVADEGESSIHAPREGCDSCMTWRSGLRSYFNPRTPRGVRRSTNKADRVNHKFQSTHPARGATCQDKCETYAAIFQSTHPVRGATTNRKAAPRAYKFQSTHPVRGATFHPLVQSFKFRISIHAPREGCDVFVVTAQNTKMAFQSTHPVRGATDGNYVPKARFNISIHAPREGCDGALIDKMQAALNISIHAPREGCDTGRL